jgi:hypothetical protein
VRSKPRLSALSPPSSPLDAKDRHARSSPPAVTPLRADARRHDRSRPRPARRRHGIREHRPRRDSVRPQERRPRPLLAEVSQENARAATIDRPDVLRRPQASAADARAPGGQSGDGGSRSHAARRRRPSRRRSEPPGGRSGRRRSEPPGGRSGRRRTEPPTGAPAAGGNPSASVCEPPAVASSASPVCAQAETFAGAPADVLLTYTAAVGPAAAAQCTGIGASGTREGFGGSDQGPSPETVRLQLLPGAAMPVKVECPSSSEAPVGAASRVATAATIVLPISAGSPSEGGVTSDPIDPKFLTELPFGRTSFWVQPWRAYLDTWSSSRLLESVGINFNVPPEDEEATAQVLQESGFKLARISIPWSTLSYEDPTTIKGLIERGIRARLTALHKHGLRPLIDLNANSGNPAPFTHVTLTTLTEAAAGARTVTLSAASAAVVVAGKTGFNNLAFGGSPDILITAVDAHGVATLSKPLPAALTPGAHGGTTLLYAPFTPPTLPNGRTNPAFASTLRGWLLYVAAVCKEAESVVGPGGYDVEVWNELSFGSQFLNAENYYYLGSDKELSEPNYEASPQQEPTLGRQKALNTKAVIKAVRAATAEYVHDPANGIAPGVGVTDGFASETPFPSGAAAPPGLTALSKHPYTGLISMPAQYKTFTDRPVNALGVQDTRSGEHGTFLPLFVPNEQLLMPEYWLTGNSTETLIRDLAPMTTDVYGFPHGREVGPPGGKPIQKWITEFNLGAPRGTTGLSAADKAHLHAKALLRSLVSMVGKGVSREYFYAAAPGSFSLIGSEFYAALEAHPGSYPGTQAAGEILTGFHNLLAHFQGPGPTGTPRQLKLTSIAQEGNHAQFTGDGTAAHPSLYDREVLAVLPFQSSPTHFVIPVYVMTSDVLTLYQPSAPTSDIHRYDLPPRTSASRSPTSPKPPHPPTSAPTTHC